MAERLVSSLHKLDDLRGLNRCQTLIPHTGADGDNFASSALSCNGSSFIDGLRGPGFGKCLAPSDASANAHLSTLGAALDKYNSQIYLILSQS
jgi:hypothetical protein